MKRVAISISVCLLFFSSLADGTTYDYVHGTDDDDTIVYGSLIEHWSWTDPGPPPVPMEATDYAGEGICVFNWFFLSPFRGTFQKVDIWDDDDADYYQIRGDLTSTGTGNDLIYPADYYDGDWIYCGGSCGFGCVYYIQVDSYESPSCVDDCSFPSDFELVISGDYDTSGYGGADVIVGWDNKDFLFGGEDDDTISGQDGRDYIYGNDGDDYLIQGGYSGAYAHYMWGGDGTDTLVGSEGNDYLYGGSGNNDEMNGNGGTDHMWGDSGTGDVCDGDGGTDYCHSISCETETNCTGF